MADDGETQDYQKMKVPELKKILKEKGLPVSGNKTELVERLQAEQAENLADVSDTLGEEDVEDALINDEDAEEGEEDLSAVPDPDIDDLLTEKENEGSKNSNTEADESKPVQNDEKPKIVKLVSSPEEPQKLLSRAARFGVVSEATKKQSRAERFGLPASNTKETESATKTKNAPPLSAISSLDPEKLKKRAERFGTTVSSSFEKVEILDKMKKRAERFGQVTSTQLDKVEGQEKLEKRKARFGEITSSTTGSTDEQAKKKLRAERFGSGK